VTREDVDRWLADYIEAWMTYDRGQVEALFAEDIVYRFHPEDDPIEGRDAVVASWLGEEENEDASDRDEPGTYEASYAAVAVEGEVAVATGTSTYFEKPGGPVARIYDNCFVMRFDAEGRCTEFTEWFMQRKSA
jgi:ketosteroid isomerase-like protein